VKAPALFFAGESRENLFPLTIEPGEKPAGVPHRRTAHGRSAFARTTLAGTASNLSHVIAGRDSRLALVKKFNS
jgi:hypothetical protein